MTEPSDRQRAVESIDLDGDVASASDAELIDSIGRGSHDALAEIYSRHGSEVQRLACRLCHRGDADDVVQDVFLRLWARPGRYDPTRGSLRSFLMMQAHGRSVDMLRGERSRRHRDITSHAERKPAAGAVDDLALARLAGERAWQLLAGLTDGERQAITLAYFDGRSYREVAVLLGQPEGTIKSRIRRGLRQLRNDMGGNEPEGVAPSPQNGS
ncbi:MAG: sigma-70 family RNA polymerase sigma factor [Acidimicrobiales bacterium]